MWFMFCFFCSPVSARCQRIPMRCGEISQNEPIILYLVLCSVFEGEIKQCLLHKSRFTEHASYEYFLKFSQFNWMIYPQFVTFVCLSFNSTLKIEEGFCIFFCNIRLSCLSNQNYKIQFVLLNYLSGFVWVFLANVPLLSAWFSMSNITAARWWF